MASFPVFTFVSDFPSFLLWDAKLQRLSSNSLIFLIYFFFCASFPPPKCIAAGVEKFMKTCSDYAILAFCPCFALPPCCHNIEFQEEKTWDRAEQWHLSWVHHSIKQQHRTLRNEKQAQLHLAEVNTVFICFVWTRRDMILLYFFLLIWFNWTACLTLVK